MWDLAATNQTFFRHQTIGVSRSTGQSDTTLPGILDFEHLFRPRANTCGKILHLLIGVLRMEYHTDPISSLGNDRKADRVDRVSGQLQMNREKEVVFGPGPDGADLSHERQ